MLQPPDRVKPPRPVEREGRPDHMPRPATLERRDQVREVETMQEDQRRQIDQPTQAQEEQRRQAERQAQAQDEQRRLADRLAREQDEQGRLADRLAQAGETQRVRADALDAQRRQAERQAQAQDEQHRLARAQDEQRRLADRLARAQEDQRVQAHRLARAQEAMRLPAARVQKVQRIRADALDAQRFQAAQGNVPERGTPEFLLFAQKAFASRFGETEALRSLWQEAAAGQPNNRDGFSEARDKFWAAIRDENDPRAHVVRGILEQAGIDLSGHGVPSLPLSRVHGAVYIDHAWPAPVPPKDKNDPDPAKWLDPDNVQFMFG